MSDGLHVPEMSHAGEVLLPGDAPAFAVPRRASRDRDAVSAWLPPLAEWLPRLGTVLWIERREVNAPTHARSSSGDGLVLLEHPAASALARASVLRACSMVTPQGPREWLGLYDEHREPSAKLFLLPDTDYLAWDQMASANGLSPIDMTASEPPGHPTFLRRALARFGHRWQARLLVFDLRQTPWVRSLGAHAPLRISLLGLDVARSIVRAENAEWVSPLHVA
ncbi:hypothetical protein ACQQ2N_07225 [Dokdonella sp. MW10]|uniref:hypothetical protein n=1 Tax=Dokdonella sp. MW10 TaxID=2992926 RepID=UPI003F7FBC5E